MRAGIIGLGHAGKKHLDAYANIEDINLIELFDTDAEAAKSWERLVLKSFANLRNNRAIDIVSICTPSYVREKYCTELAEYGKHILVEKPLALNLESAQYIIDNCHEHNVILGVVMQKRFNPDIQKLCGEVRAETLGKPLIASMQVRWYRPRTYYAGWQGEAKQGGSILINQAIHHIDILQWIMGPVESVFGYVEKLRGPLNTTDAVVATLKFQSGAIGTLEASTLVYPQTAGESLTILSEWGHRTIDTKWPYHEPIIRNFVECVKEMKEPMVTGEESLKSLKIALAIQESSDTGKEVEVK